MPWTNTITRGFKLPAWAGIPPSVAIAPTANKLRSTATALRKAILSMIPNMKWGNSILD
jgi:hypothetical protein